MRWGDALGVPVEFCDREELDLDPVVDMRGWGEVYNRKYCFNWDDDFVVIVRDKRVMKYTRSIIGLRPIL